MKIRIPILSPQRIPVKVFFIFLFFTVNVINVYAQSLIAGKISILKQSDVFKEETNLFSLSEYQKDDKISKAVSKYTFLKINRDLIKILFEKPSYLRLDIPYENGLKKFHLLLYKVDISPSGFTLLTGANSEVPVDTKIVHYRGSIDDDMNSVVSVTFSENETMAIISNKFGNYVLGKLQDKDVFIIYNDKDLSQKNNFRCGTSDDIPFSGNKPTNAQGSPTSQLIQKCVNWYWETDYDVFVSKGSLANVTAYMQGVFNQVATLYANDGIAINLKTLYVWTTTDPYTGPTAGSYLTQFKNYRTTWDGDLAHLVGYAGNGGVAYVNGIYLCEIFGTTHVAGQTGYSGISSNYSSVPTYSWTVECIAHEQGHQLGSSHTHACVWNGNNTKIDDCGGYAGYPGGTCLPQPNPVLPVGGGTIMSYCDLTSAGINFSKGFGPQPAALIVGKINASTCLTSCNSCAVPAQPGIISGNGTVCANASQTYSVTAVPGATSYTWTIPAGWTGSSVTNTITVTTGAGSGSISVTANNNCGSGTARTLLISVTNIPAQPGAITGNGIACTNSSQTYSVSAVSGATSYTWTLPSGWSGSSTTNSISVIAGSSSGAVTVKANNNCGSSPVQSAPVTIITGVPAQPAVMMGNGTVCVNSNQTFMVNAVTGATSYTWTLPTGWTGSSTTNYITVVPGTSSGSITVRANNACGSSGLLSTGITVITGVPAQPGTITAGGTLCLNTSQTYSVIPVAGATSYTWTLPGGWTGSSSTNSITIAPSTASGTLTVRANNICGSGASRSLSVSVTNVPNQPGGITGNAVIYPFIPETYTVAPVAGTTSYTWTFPAGWIANSTTNSSTVLAGATGGTVTVKANNICGSSVARSMTVSMGIVLPVRLLDFNGRLVNQSVQLTWKSTYEINCDRYEIERSADGNLFERTGYLNASGNTNSINDYTFADEHPLTGYSYYRLKIIDKDGSIEYSSIIQIKNEQTVASRYNLFPNPANDYFNLKIISPRKEKIIISLFNAEGKRVITRVMEAKQGVNNEMVHFGLLSSGTYFIILRDAENRFLYKTNVIKL